MGRVLRIVSLGLAAGVVAACSTGAALLDNDVQTRPASSARYTPEPSAVPAATATLAPAPTVTPAPTATPAPDWTALPVAASDAAGVAAQLRMVEAAIRDPSVKGAQLAYMGHLQQLLIGRLADYPDWTEPVLASLPEAHRDAVKGTLEAGKQLRSMHGAIPSRLPDWKIVAPAPVDELLTHYRDAQAEFGVEWQYLAAIHLVETRMGRIRGLSSAGAQGPMQFMPATWAAYGKGDVHDTRDAIMGAARYLKASGAPGNMQRALFAYNHAQAYVNALVAYAAVMKADPGAYRGYHGWQVYYPTTDGPFLMAVGWSKG